MHSTFLLIGGGLTALSIQSVGHPAPAVIILTIWLALGREILLRLVSGAEFVGVSIGINLVRYANVVDPAFTAGVNVLQRDIPPLMAGAWRDCVPTSELETERTRRQWQIHRGMPRRALLFLIAWNAAGTSIAWTLFELHQMGTAAGILGHAAGMTLWGFIGLLLLPTLSRSAVFAADHAAAMMGHDVRKWIKLFPQLISEDGSPNPIVQKIFYPIPATAERLAYLENPVRVCALGSVARDNLYYSWATLSPLGRAVHCNSGRPALWVYPPSA